MPSDAEIRCKATQQGQILLAQPITGVALEWCFALHEQPTAVQINMQHDAPSGMTNTPY
jgi:hypothetical protein